jgi:hypothetical protein
MKRRIGSVSHIDPKRNGRGLTEREGCARGACLRASVPLPPHSPATATILPRRAPTVPPPSSAVFLLAHDP